MLAPRRVCTTTGSVRETGIAPSQCISCSIKRMCLARDVDDASIQKLEVIIKRRRRIKKRDLLFRVNDPLSMLYVVRQGQFKMHMATAAGDEQIVGFQMAGDILGWDAIANDRHLFAASALEDSEVCELPFAGLQALIRSTPSLLNQFHRLMSEEIARAQKLMLLLSSMQAEQRMAVFLLNLAANYRRRGYPECQFQLQMSRQDIGTHLGLSIESTSRIFSSFRRRRILEISHRNLHLLDLTKLAALANGKCSE